MTGRDVAFLAVLVLGSTLAVLVGARSGRLVAGTLAVMAALAVLWIAALLATVSGWRDADGWVDCYPDCTALQDATGVTFIWAALLFAVLGLVAVVAVLLRRRRR